MTDKGGLGRAAIPSVVAWREANPKHSHSGVLGYRPACEVCWQRTLGDVLAAQVEWLTIANREFNRRLDRAEGEFDEAEDERIAWVQRAERAEQWATEVQGERDAARREAEQCRDLYEMAANGNISMEARGAAPRFSWESAEGAGPDLPWEHPDGSDAPIRGAGYANRHGTSASEEPESAVTDDGRKFDPVTGGCANPRCQLCRPRRTFPGTAPVTREELPESPPVRAAGNSDERCEACNLPGETVVYRADRDVPLCDSCVVKLDASESVPPSADAPVARDGFEAVRLLALAIASPWFTGTRDVLANRIREAAEKVRTP